DGASRIRARGIEGDYDHARRTYASTRPVRVMETQPTRSTPMLRQYFEMKSRVPDAILFYRMGDFYEMFFEDAKEAAPLLGIALTARHKDSDIEAPMCGVPYHSADHHIAKLGP